MFDKRLEFSKTGRARYLSHLDTMRVFQRALTRTEIPVAYSLGFNPHMKLSIAFPLPLGAESECEIITLKLEHPVSGFLDKLNDALPEGFCANRELPLFNLDNITHIKYEIRFTETVENIFDGRPLIVTKKTKRGFEDLDIIPHIKDAVTDGNLLRIDLSAKPPMISPALVLAVVKLNQPEIENTMIKRIGYIM